jgi:uncharacterized circularly permuted ATP-grasp superfamily protein
MHLDWNSYDPGRFYDELMAQANQPRAAGYAVTRYLRRLGFAELEARRAAADAAILALGISFTVYSDAGNIDRAWPFDIIPRIILRGEWDRVERGLKQRMRALNHFINDVYNAQQIMHDGIVPFDLIESSRDFRPQCVGMMPKFGVWAHICGTDLVRDGSGRFFVLEDNLRVPSGVSYMLENRGLTKRVLPELFENHTIMPVSDYPSQLYTMLCSLSPREVSRPEVVVITPGIYNSAYFEHAYLAQQMGVELVEGSDLYVNEDDIVQMKTIYGPRRVDVIYRRIDDGFMDPDVFNPASVLGVPGLMRAWRAGKVAIANAPGSGVADDKVVYAYVPQMIRYYLNEEAILPNVPTYLCRDDEQRAWVCDHLDELVVKPANESGGYGMLMGPMASEEERNHFRQLILDNPRNYIAQPMLSLSTVPTLTEKGLAPRHVDLRPFILQGREMFVTRGGLTRVALREGSLVVNSSQGGGSKDTWILEEGV